jgi:hypothetical protein
MPDLVSYVLNGSKVYFEAGDRSSLTTRGHQVVEGRDLAEQVHSVAAAANEVSQGFRDQLAPDELELQFGVKVSADVNWLFIARASADASILVKLTWKREPGSSAPAAPTRP